MLDRKWRVIPPDHPARIKAPRGLLDDSFEVLGDLRIILSFLAAALTGLIVILVWYGFHPISTQPWSDIWPVAFLLLVPALNLAWALWSMVSGRVLTYRLTRNAGLALVLGNLGIATGAFAGWPMSLFGPGYGLIYCALFVVTNLPIVAFAPRARSGPRELRLHRWMTIVFVGGPLAASVGGSAMNAPILIHDAERIASGSPYCVQIGLGVDGGGPAYRPVAALSDLFGSKLEVPLDGGASHTLKFTYEAFLEIDRQGTLETWAWTHGEGFSKPGPVGGTQSSPKSRCTPSRTFGRDLSWF